MSKRKNCPAPLFLTTVVSVNEAGGTLEDVVESLRNEGYEMTLDSCYQRYNTYRKAGVKLPSTPKSPAKDRGGRKLDVDALNALIGE